MADRHRTFKRVIELPRLWAVILTAIARLEQHSEWVTYDQIRGAVHQDSYSPSSQRAVVTALRDLEAQGYLKRDLDGHWAFNQEYATFRRR